MIRALLSDPEWPFAPKRMTLPDGDLHYIDEGSGPPVVLVHGTPTWSFEFRHLIRALRKTRRVIALDHLGFGLSARPRLASYTPEAHARRFATFIEKLSLDQPLSLVVHDYGGPIALDWALDHPERLAHLIVMNSWMWSFADDPQLRRRVAFAAGRLGRFLYRRLDFSLRVLMPSAYGDRKKLTPGIHARYRSCFADADSRERVLWSLARALTASKPFFDGLWERRRRLDGVPVHVVWGIADTALDERFLRRWIETYPSATVARLPGVGHWPHEEAPDTLVAIVRSHLVLEPEVRAA